MQASCALEIFIDHPRREIEAIGPSRRAHLQEYAREKDGSLSGAVIGVARAISRLSSTSPVAPSLNSTVSVVALLALIRVMVAKLSVIIEPWNALQGLQRLGSSPVLKNSRLMADQPFLDQFESSTRQPTSDDTAGTDVNKRRLALIAGVDMGWRMISLAHQMRGNALQASPAFAQKAYEHPRAVPRKRTRLRRSSI